MNSRRRLGFTRCTDYICNMPNALHIDELRANFCYDGKTLRWVRNVQHGSHKKAGDIAGSISNNGYMRVSLKVGQSKTMYMVHRLIYQMAHNLACLPDDMIVDHIDRNPLNNDISNLRLASRSENNCNINLRKDNRSGQKNITVESRNRDGTPTLYRVCVQIKKKRHTTFRKNIADAIGARHDMLDKLHGDFQSKGALAYV